MSTVRKFVTVALALLIAAPAGAFASSERQAADRAAIAAAIAQHVSQQDADRAAIREALTRPEVRDMADRMGLDVDRASAAAGAPSNARTATSRCTR